METVTQRTKSWRVAADVRFSVKKRKLTGENAKEREREREQRHVNEDRIGEGREIHD